MAYPGRASALIPPLRVSVAQESTAINLLFLDAMSDIQDRINDGRIERLDA